MTTFGEYLRENRERLALTPRDVAERANVHPTFIRGIERGAQMPSLTTALKILHTGLRVQASKEGSNSLRTWDDQVFEFKSRMHGDNGARASKSYTILSWN